MKPTIRAYCGRCQANQNHEVLKVKPHLYVKTANETRAKCSLCGRTETFVTKRDGDAAKKYPSYYQHRQG